MNGLRKRSTVEWASIDSGIVGDEERECWQEGMEAAPGVEQVKGND